MFGWFKRANNNDDESDVLEVVVPLVNVDGSVEYELVRVFDRELMDKCVECYDVGNYVWHLGKTIVAVAKSRWAFVEAQKLLMSGEVIVRHNVFVDIGDGAYVSGDLVWDGSQFKVGKFGLGRPNKINFVDEWSVRERFIELLDKLEIDLFIMDFFNIGKRLYILLFRPDDIYRSKIVGFGLVEGDKTALWIPAQGELKIDLFAGDKSLHNKLMSLVKFYKRMFSVVMKMGV